MPTRFVLASLVSALSVFGGAGVAIAAPPPAKGLAFATASRVESGRTMVFELSAAAEGALRNTSDPLRLEGVPLGGGGAGGGGAGAARNLTLERFDVITPETQFVVARPGGVGGVGGWERLATPRIAFWRGQVEGEPGSSVFIAVSETATVGSINLGSGADRFRISSRLDKGNRLPPGQVAIFKADDAVGMPDAGPSSIRPGALCGAESPENPLKDLAHALAHADEADGHDGHDDKDGEDGVRGGANVARRLRVQLAVDTDFEFYSLFGDTAAATEYVAMLYAQVSEVFLREINVGIELSFVRIWDTPTDPWDVDGNDLLPFFRSTWNNDMGAVTRDLAQLCSGRRDVPWGGIAYLNGVCNNASYSCVGYILGYFPDPSVPDAEGYDIMVTAHELGHNFGTGHTHDYGIDSCQNIDTPARRGSIMSYCSQTVSGGHAVVDLGFETSIRTIMRNYLRNRGCVDRDCNGNNVPDSNDIAGGFSQDVNANSVPDECEDCNHNGRFDSLDITLGFSTDLNDNDIPDDCEPDCNNNAVPDDRDISLGTSLDVYRDGVPDECQADCDANGQADYNQIQANMPLDIDRNRVLDDCQDCDEDGANDLFALDGSRNLWVSSSEHDEVVEFYATTGVRMRDATAAGMVAGQDVLITPDRRVLVSSGEDDRIVEFDRTGAFVRTLCQGGSGGGGFVPLDFPAGMLLTPSGTLLVVSRNNNRVLEFNASTGAFIRTVVAAGMGGLTEPFALLITPGGIVGGNELLVSGDDNTVRRYSLTTGNFLGVRIAAGAGGLDTPRGMLILPNGNLLISSLMTNQALEYVLGTGAFVGQWNHNGTNSVLRLLGPWDMTYGPDGNIYIAVNGNQGPTEFEPPPFFPDPQLHVTNTKVFRFDRRNGNFLTSFVIGQDTGLEHPAGLAFMPLDSTLDCNANQFPDSCEIAQGLEQDCNANGVPDSCDIASGPATDYNQNGVPDACECLADWNHDGIVNSTDVGEFINDWFEDQVNGTLQTDFNHNGISNSTDVSDFINAYFTGEGKC